MTTQMVMPEYQCIKRVLALEVEEVIHNENPDKTNQSCASSYGAKLVFKNKRYSPVEVDAQYVSKHNPVPGGYFVVYKGGYQSFSPKDAFESGYVPLPSFS
ncbi:hypothetical protein [Vibrio cholerae]|uniref:hypothetical protein n=1 Tax=Vibrio cholerae TaxID=666 RepID=UPI0029342632|nr:hypothetical protein [Vibrio cholerae]MDV2400260.1 hypothetical protein [Vibrio cholerae]